MKLFTSSTLLKWCCLSLIPILASLLSSCTPELSEPQDNLTNIIEKNIPLSPPSGGALAAQEYLKNGIEHLTKGSYEKASDFFNKAIRTNPQNSLTHYLNGLTYHLWGVTNNPGILPNAEVGYQTALRLDPGNSLASYNLGQLYMNANEFKKAQNEFANSLLSSPTNTTYLFSLAIASYLAQDVPTALEAISFLERLKFSNVRFFRVAALVYAASNHPLKAQEYLQKFKDLDTSLDKKVSVSLQNRINGWKEFYSIASSEILETCDAACEASKASSSLKKSPLVKKNLPKGKNLEHSKTKVTDLDVHLLSSSKAPHKDSQKHKEPDPTALYHDLEDPHHDDNHHEASHHDDSDGPYSSAKSRKMIVLNVMILRIERLDTQTYGNNIMQALNVSTGTNPALSVGYNSSLSPKTIRTGYVSLGALKYSLNIANDDKNHNELLATPSLIATHGQPSNFFSGTDYTLALTSTQGGGNLVSKEVGISLAITPFFLNDGKIVLQVNALRNFISNNPLPGNLNSTTTPSFQTDKSFVSATSVLGPGESLVLSGLTERVHIQSRDNTPVLGDMPIVSYFFSQSISQTIERSILFIISPELSEKIVRDADGNWIVIPVEEEPTLMYLKKLKGLYPNIFNTAQNQARPLEKLSDKEFSRNFRPTDMPMKMACTPELRDLLPEVREFVYD